jgi:hypothetical protein
VCKNTPDRAGEGNLISGIHCSRRHGGPCHRGQIPSPAPISEVSNAKVGSDSGLGTKVQQSMQLELREDCVVYTSGQRRWGIDLPWQCSGEVSNFKHPLGNGRRREEGRRGG